MIPHIRQKQRRNSPDGSAAGPAARSSTSRARQASPLRTGHKRKGLTEEPSGFLRDYRQGVGDGLVAGLGAVQANSCCRLTVIVTALTSAVTWLLPVLTFRGKFFEDVSPVMSMGVVTATALTLPTASTGPSTDTTWAGVTSTRVTR